MLTTMALAQMPDVWHRQGLFMGMHWAWWLFWIGTGLMILWAFWRLAADRREARRDVARMRETEAALRAKYARGEISQEQLVEGLSAMFAAPLSTSRATRGEG